MPIDTAIDIHALAIAPAPTEDAIDASLVWITDGAQHVRYVDDCELSFASEEWMRRDVKTLLERFKGVPDGTYFVDVYDKATIDGTDFGRQICFESVGYHRAAHSLGLVTNLSTSHTGEVDYPKWSFLCSRSSNGGTCVVGRGLGELDDASVSRRDALLLAAGLEPKDFAPLYCIKSKL